ncbi:C1 family peptidase [Mucilaginibacter kameinonensis]|uniref:C1 family peptidase n=1 Tax=Mucilaginibacter kameinonensis TaxID=452286 RepID=UPI000EF84F29|nr:C1 family peptidase [Mucilaginibacter kameinonensis]
MRPTFRKGSFWAYCQLTLSGMIWLLFSCGQGGSADNNANAPDTSKRRVHQPLLVPAFDSVKNIPYDTLDRGALNFMKSRSKTARINPSFFPPAGDQLEQGSCAAFCTSYSLVSYYEKRQGGYSYGERNNKPDYKTVYSPAFVFNAIKYEQRNRNCGSGIDFSQAFGLIGRKGICKWFDYPYTGSLQNCNANPGAAAFAKAATLDNYRFRRISSDIETVKEYIALEIPVIVGLYSSGSMDLEGYNHVDKTKPFLWSPASDDIDAYHAILCVGYNDITRRFILLNSWGFDWGSNGYCEVPYNVFKDRSREFYIARIDRGTSLVATDKSKDTKFSRMTDLVLDRRYPVADTIQLNQFIKDIKIIRSFKSKSVHQKILLGQLESYVADAGKTSDN